MAKYCYINMSFWHAHNSKYKVMRVKELNDSSRANAYRIRNWANNLFGHEWREHMEDRCSYVYFKKYRGSKELTPHALVIIGHDYYISIDRDGNPIYLGEDNYKLIKPSELSIIYKIMSKTKLNVDEADYFRKECESRRLNSPYLFDDIIKTLVEYSVTLDDRLGFLEAQFDNWIANSLRARPIINKYCEHFNIDKPCIGNIINFDDVNYKIDNGKLYYDHTPIEMEFISLVNVSDDGVIDTNVDVPKDDGKAMFLIKVSDLKIGNSSYNRYQQNIFYIITDGEKYYYVVNTDSRSKIHNKKPDDSSDWSIVSANKVKNRLDKNCKSMVGELIQHVIGG